MACLVRTLHVGAARLAGQDVDLFPEAVAGVVAPGPYAAHAVGRATSQT